MIEDKCRKYSEQLKKADTMINNMSSYIRSYNPSLAEQFRELESLSKNLLSYVNSPTSVDNLFGDEDSVFMRESSDTLFPTGSGFDKLNTYSMADIDSAEELANDRHEMDFNSDSILPIDESPMNSFSSMMGESPAHSYKEEREEFYNGFTSLEDYSKVLMGKVSYVDFLKAHPKIYLRNKAKILFSYMLGEWRLNSKGLSLSRKDTCVDRIVSEGFCLPNDRKFVEKLDQFVELFSTVYDDSNISTGSHFLEKLALVYWVMTDKPGITKEGVEVIADRLIFAVNIKSSLLFGRNNSDSLILADILSYVPNKPVYVGWSGYKGTTGLLSPSEVLTNRIKDSKNKEPLELLDYRMYISSKNYKYQIILYKLNNLAYDYSVLDKSSPEYALVPVKFMKHLAKVVALLEEDGFEIPDILKSKLSSEMDLMGVYNNLHDSIRPYLKKPLDFSEATKMYSPGRYFMVNKRGDY